jgi:P27 family predicted phage terminase small subunit
MRTGRPPIPTELHKLRGTYRPARHDKRAVATATPGELSAAAPAWMSETQAATWKFAIENAPRDLLKPIDGELLAAWCVACDQHRTAAAMLNAADRGSPWPLLTADKEKLTLSCYVKITNEAALRMARMAQELGFAPGSRARSAPPAKAAKDDPSQFWERFRPVANVS